MIPLIALKMLSSSSASVAKGQLPGLVKPALCFSSEKIGKFFRQYICNVVGYVVHGFTAKGLIRLQIEKDTDGLLHTIASADTRKPRSSVASSFSRSSFNILVASFIFPLPSNSTCNFFNL